MMNKKMITLDLDGTLIPHIYDISEYTIQVFKKLNELGHKVVILTGRPFRSSYFVYHKMNLDTPLVCYNGCLILNPVDKTFKEETIFMDKEDILSIYNNTKDLYTLFFSEVYDTIYTNFDKEDVHDLMHLNPFASMVIGDLNKTLDKSVHGTLILAKENKGIELTNYINKNYSTIGARMWSWGPYKEIVELYSKNTNKGKALLKVMDILDFTKEDVITTGDSINDLEMFNNSGFTISPANADPIIKEKSTIVLNETCEENGIANYFNKTFNLGVKNNGN